MSYLKVSELKDGYLYKIRARNSNLGIWLEKKGTFLISRFKFGANYLFEEFFSDPDTSRGTARPLEEIEKTPFKPEELGAWESATTKEGEPCLAYKHEDKVLEYLNEKSENSR